VKELTKEIEHFFIDLSDKIHPEQQVDTFRIDARDIVLNPKECFYILDLKDGEIIFQKKLQEVLGFTSKFFQYKDLLRRYHPDDIDTVIRISKATINHCLENPESCSNSLLQLTIRFKNDTGEYIRLLSQSTVYQTDQGSKPRLILVKLTDISFFESTAYVNWSFKADNLDMDLFKEKVFSAYHDFFTTREVEIIKMIADNKSTKEIAKELNISDFTVSTHRKNILKKAQRHSTDELIIFCKRKGIL
jgi:DNA-binding CsgD family transcriptional regulator